MKILTIPWGYFGAGNIGDEAMLQGFAEVAAPYRQKNDFFVSSRNVPHTSKAVPGFRYFRQEGFSLTRGRAFSKAAAYIFVGDTPVSDVQGPWPLWNEIIPLVKILKEKGTPIVFIASGVETLHRKRSRELVADVLAPNVRHWALRSDEDRKRLAGYGVPYEKIDVTADLAWLLAGKSVSAGFEAREGAAARGGEFVVGVNMTNEPWMESLNPFLFREVARALDTICTQRRARIVFLSNEVRDRRPFDGEAARRCVSLMKSPGKAVILPPRYRTPQEMMSIVAGCSITIGMRYHFCIFSAIQGVPFIGIERSDKMADLFRDLNWEFRTPLAEVTGERLVNLSEQLFAEKEAASDKLSLGAARMKERATANRDVLAELVRSM